MKATVTGISAPMKFATADGTQIEGTTVHYLCNRDGVTGQAAASKFVKAYIWCALPHGLAPGDVVNFDFNESGKVVGIDLITPTGSNSSGDSPTKGDNPPGKKPPKS